MDAALTGHYPTETMAAKRKVATKKARKAKTQKKKTSVPSRPTPQAGSGLAPGMQTVNTFLAVANVGATADFLERAFGFARGVVLPDTDGQLRYAEMRHGGSVVMLIRKGDATAATGGAAALYTYVDDVDRVTAQAREAGAGVGDAEDKPWGDRVAVVTDPDGYRWVLATFKKLAPFS
jgi:uncharacterized glyoxalase superfamily protein PhnB